MNSYVITSLCVGVKDKACIPACPVDCIREGDRQVYIKPGECICCSACVPECPVAAIFPDDEVPAGMKASIQENADFFKGGITAT